MLIWSADGLVETDQPARFAGISTTKIFGRLTCPSGERAHAEHRVFFAAWDDALAAGYRPCLRCRPQPDDRYEREPQGRWRLL